MMKKVGAIVDLNRRFSLRHTLRALGLKAGFELPFEIALPGDAAPAAAPAPSVELPVHGLPVCTGK